MVDKKKFLSLEVLDEAAREIALAASDEGVRAALIGGYALQLYGSTRLTGDVDVAAAEPIRALPGGKALSFGGYQTEAPSGVPVDLVLRDDDYAPLYAEALERAVEVEGAPMPVATPEHLAAMKMVAGRARDQADLEWLVTSGVADVREARRVIKRHLGPYAAGEFDLFVEEARWRAARDGRAE